MSNTAYIYDAVRTPRSKGKADGSLHEVKPIDLGAGLLRALQQRQDLDTSYVDDVVMGCVSPVGEQGSDIAKMIVQNADWDESVAGVQLNRFCASGLEAINTAAAKVAAGWDQLVVAGGIECMSRVPMGSDGGAMGMDAAFAIKESFVPQGIGADTIATIDGYSREDVDAYALESQKRATAARDNGWFDGSVIPVTDKNGVTILHRDDFIKPNTTMEALAGLRASFAEMGKYGFDDIVMKKYPQLEAVNHVHTPGNSSGIVDGASAVLIGSKQAGQDLGLTPRARVVATAILSTDPIIMLTGPGPAAKKALKTAGMSASDIDLWEINEAFASVALRYMRDLGIEHDITNVVGGAIAMGHPLGATGGCILSSMLDELERRDLNRGMLSLCVGGGMGISTIIERV
ncbi:acetyl-CoA acetyltransferase [Arenicella chitinivorans]|uniref:Acetyl-CoA acetyltransferase n=1 Tax=Arenicella chitinivorans TaxID=1329800 RepID=A0A918VT75_9GAMM|nr:acetyl-CoA C-acetyltransferase [Arenicella chitinivorans]GHA21670.1 acetyl-CoA acetyltransferase [Arenicella chitinivorans]